MSDFYIQWPPINGGGGSGSVTSVGLVDSTGLFNITGTPVTGAGNLTLGSLVIQTQHEAFMAPAGGNGAPGFRTIVAGDLPSFGSAAAGIVPASGGGTTNFLRADGTWAAAGGGGSYTFSDSLVNTSGTVTLINDSAAPGNSMFYGTNSSGTLGWYAQPSGEPLFTAWTASTPGLLAGYEAGRALTTGYGIFLGPYAGQSATTGIYNIAIGLFASRNNTTGSNNVAIGNNSLVGTNGSTTGGSNTAIGTYALTGVNTGSANVGLGFSAGSNATTQSNQFFLGNVQQSSYADDQNYSLLYGTFSGTAGSLVGQNLTINGRVTIPTIKAASGTYYVTVDNGGNLSSSAAGSVSGFGYLASNTSVYGGTYSTLSFIGSYNTIIGVGAGSSLSNGGANTALGNSALYFLTTGNDNTAVGASALYSVTTGPNNTAVGTSALISLTTGSDNTALGNNALSNAMTGSGNIALGYNVGFNLTTQSNQFFVGNIAQSSYANDQNYSLLYGTFSGTAGSLTGQQLTINGALNCACTGGTSGSASPAISSGVYTPTITNGSGASSITAEPAQWSRIGNIVTVSGSFIATTGGTATVIITLPTTTANFSTAYQANGTVCTASAGMGYVTATSSAQTVTAHVAGATTGVTFGYTFMYQVQ